jgi:hypothetical protein
MYKHLLAAGLLAASTFGASAQQNLVQNGSMNTTASRSEMITNSNLPGWITQAVGSDPTAGDWSVIYRSADETRTTGAVSGYQNQVVKLWQNPQITASPDGGSFLAVDADPLYNSKISQTITGLVTGQTYNLSFWFAGAQFTTRTGATTEWWDVTFGDTTQRTAILSNASQGFTGWQKATMSFVATSSSELLTFLAGGTPAGQPPVVLLDGISLTAAVPEPSTAASLLLGVLLIGSVRLRRRRLSDR